jgi:hypothetical protein
VGIGEYRENLTGISREFVYRKLHVFLIISIRNSPEIPKSILNAHFGLRYKEELQREAVREEKRKIGEQIKKKKENLKDKLIVRKKEDGKILLGELLNGELIFKDAESGGLVAVDPSKLDLRDVIEEDYISDAGNFEGYPRPEVLQNLLKDLRESIRKSIEEGSREEGIKDDDNHNPVTVDFSRLSEFLAARASEVEGNPQRPQTIPSSEREQTQQLQAFLEQLEQLSDGDLGEVITEALDWDWFVAERDVGPHGEVAGRSFTAMPLPPVNNNGGNGPNGAIDDNNNIGNNGGNVNSVDNRDQRLADEYRITSVVKAPVRLVRDVFGGVYGYLTGSGTPVDQEMEEDMDEEMDSGNDVSENKVSDFCEMDRGNDVMTY